MISWLKKTFEDEKGKPSSKRITVFAAILILIQSSIADQYFKKVPTEFVFNSWYYIVIVGIGLTAGVAELITAFKGNKQNKE